MAHLSSIGVYFILALAGALLGAAYARAGRRAGMPALTVLALVYYMEALELLCLNGANIAMGYLGTGISPIILVSRSVTVARFAIGWGFLLGARFGRRDLIEPRLGVILPYVASGYAGAVRQVHRKLRRRLLDTVEPEPLREYRATLDARQPVLPDIAWLDVARALRGNWKAYVAVFVLGAFAGAFAVRAFAPGVEVDRRAVEDLRRIEEAARAGADAARVEVEAADSAASAQRATREATEAEAVEARERAGAARDRVRDLEANAPRPTDAEPLDTPEARRRADSLDAAAERVLRERVGR